MNNYQQFGLVLAAAGKSSRFGDSDKLLVELEGKALFLHALLTFSQIMPIANIVIVVSPGQENTFRDILKPYSQMDNVLICEGGQERQNSVLNGINKLNDSLQYVAVHDAARPYITQELIIKSFDHAIKNGNAVVAKAVTDTIKIVDEKDCVLSTPARATLRAAETPQIFPLDFLKKAYTTANQEQRIITDESMAAEQAGERVHLFVHHGNNIKITYQHDL